MEEILAKRIAYVFFTTLFIAGPFVICATAAKENTTEAKLNLEYKAGKFRDPFGVLFEGNVSGQGQEETQGPTEEQALSAPHLKVEGIVWGGRFPQAIVNDKVVKIGDKIAGLRIISIDKDGIIAFFQGRRYKYLCPK